MSTLCKTPTKEFFKLQKEATQIEYSFDYLIGGGCSPLFAKLYVNGYTKAGDVIYEPFAGRWTALYDVCSDRNLISYDLFQSHPWVSVRDSTENGPSEAINGAFVHPPYYGSMPFSGDSRDLSRFDDLYTEQYSKVVSLLNGYLNDGFVAVVGRSLHSKGLFRHLHWEFSSIFLDLGYSLVTMYNSVPDYMVVLRKGL